MTALKEFSALGRFCIVGTTTFIPTILLPEPVGCLIVSKSSVDASLTPSSLNIMFDKDGSGRVISVHYGQLVVFIQFDGHWK